MEYENSEEDRIPPPLNKRVTDGVTLRRSAEGYSAFAVFDGEEQVSEEYSEHHKSNAFNFLTGYSKAKEEYEGE